MRGAQSLLVLSYVEFDVRTSWTIRGRFLKIHYAGAQNVSLREVCTCLRLGDVEPHRKRKAIASNIFTHVVKYIPRVIQR